MLAVAADVTTLNTLPCARATEDQQILVIRIGRIVPMDDYLLGSVSSTVPENRSVVG